MTEKQYNYFCDENYYDEDQRIEHRKLIERTNLFLLFKLHLAIEEFKQAVKSSLPKWMRINND